MLVAITGGIGSGKSVVSQLLRVMGYPVYDCDANAKSLMTSDPILRQDLISLFGPETYQSDGTLDKPFLSKAIFSSPELLAKMNAAVHPAVARDIAKHHSLFHGELFFYESAILFESGFNKLAVPDKVLCVTAPLELRISRTMARDNSSRESVLKRINSQMSQEEKSQLADYEIKNDDRNSIIVQIEKVLKEL